MAAILNSANLHWAILVFPLKLTHTCQDWFPPFAQKNFTHSFSLNLMMAVIWNSAILVSAILVFPLTPPKISSHYLHKKTSLIHSDSTWWWQPYCILPWLIQTPCFLLWDSLQNTLSPLWLWLKLIQSDSNSFILTQLDGGSNLEFCQFALSHLSFPSQTHSHLQRLVPTLCTKKPWLIDSDSTWWWQSPWTLPYWIQTLPSWIQTPCYLLSDSLKNTLSPLWLWLKLIQSDSNSFILTELDDGSHLECCHLGFSHLHKKTSLMYSHSNWWWQPSWILPSWIQLFCTKKLHLFILTPPDDGSYLELCPVGFKHCHLWFRHLVIFSQIHSKTFFLQSDSDSN